MISHSRPYFSETQVNAVADALRRGELSRGRGVEGLEFSLSAMFGGAHAVVCSSGTSALYLALQALGVRSGDRVVIPSYTCNSLYSAVVHAGAEAVCCDAGEGMAVADLEPIGTVSGGGGRAVILPHMFGYLADIDGIRNAGYTVIEDCAQAVGVDFPDGLPVGSKGNVSVFSFYATKLIPAGEGGACVTGDRDMADTMRKLRNCDEAVPDARAFNFKMSDLSAYSAIQQLADIRRSVAERARLADEYDRAFGACSYRKISRVGQAVCFRYLVSLLGTAWEKKGVEEFIRRAVSDTGIQCRRPVWQPLHRTIGGNCPNADALHETLVSIPLYPGLGDDEAERICCNLPRLIGN